MHHCGSSIPWIQDKWSASPRLYGQTLSHKLAPALSFIFSPCCGVSFLSLVRLSCFSPPILSSSVPLSYSVQRSSALLLTSTLFWLNALGPCLVNNPDIPANLQCNDILFSGYVVVWVKRRALPATDTMFVLRHSKQSISLPHPKEDVKIVRIFK